jgi:5-methylthioadenosine/S-adenosylhomocysteine deaminase
MRMASLLARVRLLDGTALDATTAFALGTASAADVLGLDAGRIVPGALADLVAVDLAHPSLAPPTDVLKSVVYAMSPQAITDVWVHGERAVERGRLVRRSHEEIVTAVREATRGFAL